MYNRNHAFYLQELGVHFRYCEPIVDRTMKTIPIVWKGALYGTY